MSISKCSRKRQEETSHYGNSVRTVSSSLTCQYKDRVATRASGFSDTVWVEFTPLAVKHKAVNLSQGLPSIPVEPFILTCLQEAAGPGMHHQYTRVGGHPPLVNALAKHYSPGYNTDIDPTANICISTGATQGLMLFFQTFVNPGDEVIVIEPFYDSYIPQIEMCGGKAVTVPLRPPVQSKRNSTDITVQEKSSSADWKLSLDELEAAISPQTKAMVLNTPHNPSGKVFTREELDGICKFIQKHDLLLLSDEVYEKILYDENEHVHVGSLPDMWNRTVSLGSVGKAFNTTGWKLGWAIGPHHLIAPMQLTQQYTPFCVSTPLQEALAKAFSAATQNVFAAKRELLIKALDSVGFRPIEPQGAYFILADTSDIHFDIGKQEVPYSRDYDFCRWLTKEVGVAAIPPSCFYTLPNKHLAKNLARFCFVKANDDIHEAAQRLQQHFLSSQPTTSTPPVMPS
eukprot:gene10513-2641_t